MRAPLLPAFLVIVSAAVCSCSSDPSSKTSHVAADPTVTIPPDVKLLAPPKSDPRELPGVDTSELNDRERRAYWRWVSQLYAPCPDVATSIAECVEQDRPCASCTPAAQFLAQRARQGASQGEAITAFRVRFGSEVKKVDMADSPATGPVNAPVTMVVWSDFECPACGYALPKIDALLEKYPNDIRLVHKLYPLKAHPHSRAAAHAAIAARRQGKYWEMEKALFSHQKHLEDADLEEYARNVGLDLARYAKDIADPKADEIIERDRAEADKNGFSGTPFILINGHEFELGLFKIDRDLETWVTTEIDIARRQAELRAAAAVGAALTGAGRGPVGPLSTGVPAATAAPPATAPATAAPATSSP